MKKKKLLLLLKIALTLVLVAALSVLLIRHLEYRKGAKDYAAAEQLLQEQPAQEAPKTEEAPPQQAEEPEQEPEEVYVDPYMETMSLVTLTALREQNEDVVGWISIPQTSIYFPVVQGESNTHYLRRTWKDSYSYMGSIFMECKNAPDFSDFNTIIYGHNMRNGTMFSDLKNYMEPEYWKEHPSIYIVSDAGVHRYDVFAAFETGVYTLTYGLGITEVEDKEEVIRIGLESSAIDTGVVPTADDQILTLSTCTGNNQSKRWVVQAVLNDGAPQYKLD